MNGQPVKSLNSVPQQTEALDKTPPHGLKGSLSADGNLSPRPFLMGASAILILALIATSIMMMIDWYRRRARMKSLPGSLLIDPTAWARLRDSIANIHVPDEARMGDSGDQEKQWNDFSSEVSLCLRRGLELRTGFPLAESTTEEIMMLLTKRQIQLVVLSDYELRLTLERLDRIRFGGMRISTEDATQILNALKSWCERLEADDRQKVPSSLGVPQMDGKGGVRVFD